MGAVRVAPLGVGDENHDQDLAFTAFRKSFWANLQKAEEDLRRATEKGVSGPIGDEDDDDDDDDANGATGEPLVCPAATEQCVFLACSLTRCYSHNISLILRTSVQLPRESTRPSVPRARRSPSNPVTPRVSRVTRARLPSILGLLAPREKKAPRPALVDVARMMRLRMAMMTMTTMTTRKRLLSIHRSRYVLASQEREGLA